MERNPQIRWSCEGTPAAALADRTRPDVDGRLLFIFDSPDHPLRHVSFRRVHQDPARAGQDLASTLAAIEARHGAPSKAQGELPAQREGGPLFEKWSLIEREWRYADLVVTATALDFGERGVDVYEAVEVPYPVRSDAPATAGTAPLDPAANL